MSFLETRTATLPLSAGVQTGHDSRALPAPGLALCQNVEFDEDGGLQTRRPFGTYPLDIVGGGTISDSDLRKVTADGDELLLWTRDSLYSWSEGASAWTLRQAYEAPAVTERTVFTRSDDQVFCERAELSGVAVYVWAELGAATRCFVAAEDVETGSVLMGPTQIGNGGQLPTRPHVVAQTTRFLVTFFEDSANTIEMFQIDPAAVASSTASGIAATTTVGTLADGPHDVVVAANGDAYVAHTQLAGAGYLIARVTSAFALTTRSIGRAASRVAVAVAPGTTEINIIRHDAAGATIRSDRLHPTTLADTTVNVSLGAPLNTTVNQIACAYRDVTTGGAFRCYAFWSCGETAGGGTSASTFVCESNYVDTAGAVGTKIILARRLGVASRAFAYDGRVHIWLSFAGESEASGMGRPLTLRAALQNAYYLFRDNATDHNASQIAKAVTDRAGGFNGFSGHCGTVQALSSTTFVWAGIARRIIQLGENQTSYSGRGPRIVTLELDSDEARRTAKLGRTLYVAGGQILQYDGVGLVEVGFHILPWAFQTVTIAGALPAGTYNHKMSTRWSNARQERDQSSTICAAATLIAASQRIQFAGPPPLSVTMKKNERAAPELPIWRTKVNPVPDAPFQLVTSVNPASLTNPNRYMPNDPTLAIFPTFEDNMLDAALELQESYPENAGVLPRLTPTPAGIIIATQDRLILGRVAEDPLRVDYSLLRGVDEVAAFNGRLQFYLPPDGGPITALMFHAETLFAWKESAIFAIAGDGFDNVGQGNNYGPSRLISSDLGAISQECVALTPAGPLFKSRKGWYLLRGWTPVYVGRPVAAFDSDVVTAITVVESQHQVRILSAQRMLVWDYETESGVRDEVGSWSDWTIEGGRSSVMWKGEHIIIAESTPGSDMAVMKQTDFGDPDVAETFAMDIETAWIRLSDLLLGQQTIWHLMPLGEHRSAHRLRVRLKRNYNDSTYFDDVLWTSSPASVGGPLMVRHGPSILQNTALKIRLTTQDAVTSDPPAGEALKLTGIGFEYGVETGLFRDLPAAQKQ